MSKMLFLLLNLFIVILLVRLLFKDTKRPQPSKLNLSKKKGVGYDNSSLYSVGEKELNVMFNYNGESWDAYEVLGIPAGSPIEDVNKAYEKLKNNKDQEEIIKKALQAIKNQI